MNIFSINTLIFENKMYVSHKYTSIRGDFVTFAKQLSGA